MDEQEKEYALLEPKYGYYDGWGWDCNLYFDYTTVSEYPLIVLVRRWPIDPTSEYLDQKERAQEYHWNRYDLDVGYFTNEWLLPSPIEDVVEEFILENQQYLERIVIQISSISEFIST